MKAFDLLENKYIQITIASFIVMWSYFFRRDVYYLIVWNPQWIYFCLAVSMGVLLVFINNCHVKFIGNAALYLFIFLLCLKIIMLLAGVRYEGNLTFQLYPSFISLIMCVLLALKVDMKNGIVFEKLINSLLSAGFVVFLLKMYIR